MFLVSCCLLLAFVFLSLMFLFFVRWTCALALKQPSSVTSDVLVWLVHRSLCCVGAFLGSIISFWFFLMLQARAPLGSCASVLPAGTLYDSSSAAVVFSCSWPACPAASTLVRSCASRRQPSAWPQIWFLPPLRALPRSDFLCLALCSSSVCSPARPVVSQLVHRSDSLHRARFLAPVGRSPPSLVNQVLRPVCLARVCLHAVSFVGSLLLKVNLFLLADFCWCCV
jgi:hypothetical protein